MKKETIRKVGIEKGVKDLDVFVEFFSRRFPNESEGILSYVSGWADRFNTGHPEYSMDGMSKKIYDEVKSE